MMSTTVWMCAATLLAGNALRGMKNMVFVPLTCCLYHFANLPNYSQVARLHCAPSLSGTFPAVRSLIFASLPVVGWMTVLKWWIGKRSCPYFIFCGGALVVAVTVME